MNQLKPFKVSPERLGGPVQGRQNRSGVFIFHPYDDILSNLHQYKVPGCCISGDIVRAWWSFGIIMATFRLFKSGMAGDFGSLTEKTIQLNK